MFNNFLFFNRAVYEIMWINTAQPDRPQMTTWRIRFACWIPKPTKRHSEYVILIAFPLQLSLHERVSMLPYRYIAITPVCVCRPDLIGGASESSGPNRVRKMSHCTLLLIFSGVALFHKHREAFVNVRSHTYWYTLPFKCFHLPLGLLRCATSSSLEGTTGLGMPPSYSPLCPR